MAPYTHKAKRMKKADLVAELNKVETERVALAAEIKKLRTEATAGIEAIREDIAANKEMLENPEAGGFAFGQLAQSIVQGLPMKEFAVKATIAFIYGYTLGMVGTYIAGALALLAMPAWITFVLTTLLVVCLVYVAITTTWPVSSFTYNTVAKTFAFIKRETLAAREWVEKTAADIRADAAQREVARHTVQ